MTRWVQVWLMTVVVGSEPMLLLLLLSIELIERDIGGLFSWLGMASSTFERQLGGRNSSVADRFIIASLGIPSDRFDGRRTECGRRNVR